MKQIYLEQFTWVEPSTPVNYVYGERVDQNQLLEIRHMVVRHSGIATNELAAFGIEYIAHQYWLGEDFALVTGGYPQWDGKFTIGEGYIPFGYVPDSADGDVLQLTITGYLYDKDCWQYEHSLYLAAQK
jgi:hypothetical protein